MCDSSFFKEQIEAARSSGHRLAGMLGSMSMGLYCIKADAGSADRACCIDDMEKCLKEANDELDKIRLILRKLDQEDPI